MTAHSMFDWRSMDLCGTRYRKLVFVFFLPIRFRGPHGRHQCWFVVSFLLLKKGRPRNLSIFDRFSRSAGRPKFFRLLGRFPPTRFSEVPKPHPPTVQGRWIDRSLEPLERWR